MKIALTGSSGFIGSALTNFLSENKDIILHSFDKNKYSLTKADSLKEFVIDKDIIIHLAGITQTKNSADFAIVNAEYTHNLLEAISLYGKNHVKLIFLSSFAVYEELTIPTLLDEDTTKTIPRNEYGMSKLLAEKYITFYSQKKQINAYILRLANVYGPGMKETTRSVIYNCITNIQTHTPIAINGNGKQMRDFIYIDDIIQAITKCINDKTHNFLIVNICSSQETEVIKIVKDIESILGKNAILHFNKANKEKGYWIGNNKKALKELGFKAQITLDDGLKKTIQWYKNKTL